MEREHIVKRYARQLVRYLPRILAILVIAGALTWFFFLRPDDNKRANTTNTTTSTQSPETKVSSNTPTATPTSGGATQSATTSAPSGQSLPDTGPAETIGVFVLATIAGTLFWHRRLRKQEV